MRIRGYNRLIMFCYVVGCAISKTERNFSQLMQQDPLHQQIVKSNYLKI